MEVGRTSYLTVIEDSWRCIMVDHQLLHTIQGFGGRRLSGKGSIKP
jgi:hypothetical protein